MKLVVTGGLGFIGANFASYMRKKAPHCRLICIDHQRAPMRDVRALYDDVVTRDFSAVQSEAAYRNADAVIHLAATTTVQESIQDPYRSFENNVIKTQKLLDILRHQAPATQFVFASTGGAIIGEHNGAIHENIPPRPVSPYGATKLAVEGLLSAYSGSFGLRAAALRFSNVYGPGSAHKGSVVAAFCRAYLDTGHLIIHGDGHQTRDYVHVDDISQAIFKTIRADASGPFQLGTGHATSILQLVETLRRITPELGFTVEHRAALTGEVKHNLCDISHAQKYLGYQPEQDLEGGLRQTLAWFKKQRTLSASAQETAA